MSHSLQVPFAPDDSSQAGARKRDRVLVTAVDRLVKLETDILATRAVFEHLSIVALGGLSRRLGAHSGPASPADPADGEQDSPSPLAYLARRQGEVLRDWAIAEHDYAKRLLIVAQPLLSTEIFSTLWLGLRNSGDTPRVQVHRTDHGRVILFSSPTGRRTLDDDDAS